MLVSRGRESHSAPPILLPPELRHEAALAPFMPWGTAMLALLPLIGILDAVAIVVIL
ncbi:hypothetical protein MGWOODY_Smn3356 [hydrothermal vent metagenome]|jgi:hypothetical protein|uniref:Uncharacterized protein n=1 Tax=hydrothermal vent metagenome TaxID=652676 RepID=A0A170PNY3_9ZZZZ